MDPVRCSSARNLVLVQIEWSPPRLVLVGRRTLDGGGQRGRVEVLVHEGEAAELLLVGERERRELVNLFNSTFVFVKSIFDLMTRALVMWWLLPP